MACNKFFSIGIFAISTFFIPLIAKGEDGGDQNKCFVGPLKRTYGKSNWLVYGCSDEKTLIIVSDTGSPAMPFVFALVPKGDAYELVGEGDTPRKDLTYAAFEQLRNLSHAEIIELIKATKSVKKN